MRIQVQVKGLVRATSDSGLSQALAIAETLLALVIFICCIAFVRQTRQTA